MTKQAQCVCPHLDYIKEEQTIDSWHANRKCHEIQNTDNETMLQLMDSTKNRYYYKLFIDLVYHFSTLHYFQ